MKKNRFSSQSKENFIANHLDIKGKRKHSGRIINYVTHIKKKTKMKLHSMSHANQGIFDKNGNLVAHEVLYRNGTEGYPCGTCPLYATSSVIVQSCYSVLDMDYHKLFVNFDRQSLDMRLFSTLRPDMHYIEVLETSKPMSESDYFELFSLLSEARDMGFTLVLDDFSLNGLDRWGKIFELVSIIKIDVRETCIFSNRTNETMQQIHRKYPHIKFLAEKIENQKEYDQCLLLGFSFFQGYHFDTPRLRSKQIMLPNSKTLNDLYQHLHNPYIDSGLSLNELSEKAKAFLFILMDQYCYKNGKEEVIPITDKYELTKLKFDLVSHMKPYLFLLDSGNRAPSEVSITLGSRG